MPEPKPTQSPISEPVEPKFQEVLQRVVEESYQWGIEKYGTPLMTFNGRSELRDMAEELVSGLRYGTQLAMRCEKLQGLLWEAINIMTIHGVGLVEEGPLAETIKQMKFACGYPQ